MYCTSFQGDYRVYTSEDDRLDIFGGYIFKKMRDFGWEVCSYSYNSNYIDLFGGYPKDKFVKIKKFFYDEYPLVVQIQPKTYGIRIFFAQKVVLIYNSLNTTGLN